MRQITSSQKTSRSRSRNKHLDLGKSKTTHFHTSCGPTYGVSANAQGETNDPQALGAHKRGENSL